MNKKKPENQKSASIQFRPPEEEGFNMEHVMDSIPQALPKKNIVIAPPSQSPQVFSKPPVTWNTPDDTIDLHGKTREEAIMMVQNFVMNGYHLHLGTLLIITGKGHRSGVGGPILKRTIWDWLKKNGKSYVKSFSPAPSEHGGAGAVWLELL